MRKVICSICGYVYDETVGDPERGIAPGTKWEDLPEDWDCPLCGAGKEDFAEEKMKPQLFTREERNEEHETDTMRELSFGEMSALCSNFSKGCEKQYRFEEAELLDQLAKFYQTKSNATDGRQLKDISDRIRQDLGTGYAQANAVAAGASDRGALRALVWGEKVTKILTSLLGRYEKQQDALLENTHIYVCEICGFVYVGDSPPDICPVCKVPNQKITEVKRR